MNSPESNRVHNIKSPNTLYINESPPRADKFETDDIPYLSEKFDRIVDETDDQPKSEYSQYNMETNCKNDNDELNLNALNSWGDTTEEDVGFQDDNVSHVGSDYSEFHATEQDNPFAQPNPPDNVYGSSGGEMSDTEMKYTTPELMLRPPSGSAMHFNYNFPAMPPQQETNATSSASMHRHAALRANNSQHPYLYGSQHDMSASSTSSAASAQTNYPTNASPNAGCFHPNMWYPNAPFGTYRSYGSHAYGRHYGSQLPPDHMMDMFQLSNR